MTQETAQINSEIATADKEKVELVTKITRARQQKKSMDILADEKYLEEAEMRVRLAREEAQRSRAELERKRQRGLVERTVAIFRAT